MEDGCLSPRDESAGATAALLVSCGESCTNDVTKYDGSESCAAVGRGVDFESSDDKVNICSPGALLERMVSGLGVGMLGGGSSLVGADDSRGKLFLLRLLKRWGNVMVSGCAGTDDETNLGRRALTSSSLQYIVCGTPTSTWPAPSEVCTSLDGRPLDLSRATDSVRALRLRACDG